MGGFDRRGARRALIDGRPAARGRVALDAAIAVVRRLATHPGVLFRSDLPGRVPGIRPLRPVPPIARKQYRNRLPALTGEPARLFAGIRVA